jgi:hypothetical protein
MSVNDAVSPVSVSSSQHRLPRVRVAALVSALGLGLALAMPTAAHADSWTLGGITCAPNGAPVMYALSTSTTSWGTTHEHRLASGSRSTSWLGGPVPVYHDYKSGWTSINTAHISAIPPLGWVVSAGVTCTN